MTLPLYGPEAVDSDSSLLRVGEDIARRAGMTLHDWQRYVLAAAMEQRDGQYVHRTVGVLVPRQCGKTTLAHVRAIIGSSYGEHVAYSAQDRLSAREKWGECVAAAYRVLGPDSVQVRWANGREIMHVRRSGSFGGGSVRIVTPNERGPRGLSLSCVILDEAFRHQFTFLSAIMPTLATHDSYQLWLMSNAGDRSSEVLRHYRDLGRDGTPGVCWIEWAAPEDCDTSDIDVWRQAIPTLDKPNGISLSTLTEMHRTMPPEVWEREMLNLWQLDDGRGVIDMRAWSQLSSSSLKHDDDTLCLGAAVNMERDHACIAAASVSDDVLAVEMIDVQDGPVTWLADRLQELSAKHGCPVAVDGGGPTGTVCVELGQRGLPVIELGARQYARACAMLTDRIESARFCHWEHPALTAAAASAAKRRLMAGWAWQQSDIQTMVTPLEAATVAAWGAATREPSSTPTIHVWED